MSSPPRFPRAAASSAIRLRPSRARRSRPESPEARAFDLVEFKRRVAKHAGISEDEADRVIRAVFATLAEAVTGGELDDVLVHLPDEYLQVIGAVARSAP